MTNKKEKLPEDGPFVTDMTSIKSGKRVSFEVDGKIYYLNFPTDEQRDEYAMLRDVWEIRLRERDDFKELAKMPLPQKRQAEINREIDLISERMDNVDDVDERNYWTRRIANLYEELENSSAADYVIERHLRIRLNRWLARQLLADEDGNTIATSKNDWNNLAPIIQDEATAKAAMIMQALHLIRFLSETPQD